MKKLLSYWKIILVVIIVGIIGLRAYQRFYAPKEAQNIATVPEVELLDILSSELSSLEASCRVEPQSNVLIQSETSGTIETIYVEDGAEVEEGDLLLEVENIRQRVSLQDAAVAIDTAELALQDLLDENDFSNSGSLAAQTRAQQEAALAQAQNAYFNTDLRAYPADGEAEETLRPAPQVTGDYTCGREGEYRVEVYSSSADSGASFRFTGLESGTSTVSTTAFGTDLGNCGLELVFEDGFDRNEDWIIPVPNKRSSQFTQVEEALELAESNKDLALNQSTVSDEAIAQARGRVRQAQLGYELALDNLNKTQVRAEVDGIVTGFNIDEGNFIQIGESLGSVKTIDNFELVANVRPEELRFLEVGSMVMVEDVETVIIRVNRGIDTTTNRSRVVIEAPEGIELTENEQVNCSITRSAEITISSNGAFRLPLSAVSIIGTDSYVFIYNNDGTVSPVSVELGALFGSEVEVFGLNEQSVIKDARGLQEGSSVTLMTQEN
ncbi:MAG: HlyD family efflux transporter periplasmic adaptor subunit [Candidatus Pacebacteria bacterium]|nr:HlyD family efflux transporter periplasmic adaptor subunit [Candidatus Paceibacterota bacterium]